MSNTYSLGCGPFLPNFEERFNTADIFFKGGDLPEIYVEHIKETPKTLAILILSLNYPILTPSIYQQAQLRLCKLGPGTVFSIRFFSEIKILSVALLSQASLMVGCILASTYDFQAKIQFLT